MKKCFVCDGEILDSHRCFNFYEKKQAICMGCECAEIEVWRISLPGEKGGYVDQDFQDAIGAIEHIDIDDSFEIHKEMMSAIKYLSLSEFQGF